MAKSVAGALSPRSAGKRAMDVEGGFWGYTRLPGTLFREEDL